jgi:acyl-coenzyme A synthetase/AMP-(fatty) acid ligase
MTMGDQIQLLPSGMFDLIGRADRIVKIEGKRLALTDMEKILKQHPYIDDAYAILIETYRQSLAIILVLNPAGKKTLQSIGKNSFKQAIRSWLSDFYEPVLRPRIIRYVDAFPFNSQGKIIHHEMVELVGAVR